MRNSESIGLIPLYIKRKTPNANFLFKAYQKTVVELKNVVEKVIVINDGSDNKYNYKATLNLQVNKGKAEAVRRGLQIIGTKKDENVKYIIQTDADLDQNPKDAKLILQHLETHKDSNTPILVIGDRYSQGQAEKSPHRQGLLALQQSFCAALGYPKIRDHQSGFRGYSGGFAQELLKHSTSTGYGMEAEQIVIANSIGAKVFTVPLTHSRLRDESTLSSKFLEAVDAILMHRQRLMSEGYESLIHFFEKMKKYRKQ